MVDKTNIKYNGSVKLTAFRNYIDWYSALDYKASSEQKDLCKEWIKDLCPPSYIKPEAYTPEQLAAAHLAKAIARFFGVEYWCSYDNMDEKYAPIRAKGLQLLFSLLSFAEDFEQQVKVALWSDRYALIYIGNAAKGVLVVEPGKYMEYIPERDYSEMTPAQMALTCGAGQNVSVDQLVPSEMANSLTVKQAREELEKHEEKLRRQREHIDQASRCESPELIALKNQIETLKQEMWAKKEALMEQLEEKLEEMEEMKFKLEGQIYLLDSQIYSILCYTGETVNFARIRSGKKADDKEPIIIHQKLHYLDEDLGRLASIYSIDWHEIDMFESFLAHHPLALDTFAPNDRCVTLVRLSRNNRKLGMGCDQYGNYNNIMEHYEYFHGSTVGIIIRNGENLWLGWCDEDRIDIADDLIIDKKVTDVSPASVPEFTWKSDRKKYLESERRERKRVLDGLVSRSFVYSILQGVVDHTDMLPLPNGIKLDKQSEYVIYAVADKWLTDRRFGYLEDIVKAANADIREGDMVLTTQYLVPEREYGMGSGRYYDERWHNTRGIGDKNRTHDCRVDDCTVYPINKIDQEPDFFEARYKKDGTNYRTSTSYYSIRTEEELAEFMEKNYPEVSEYEPRKVTGDRHIYVSIRKQGEKWIYGVGFERTNARANFELYSDEYINLENLTSIHLEYAITNREVSAHFKVGGKVADYAYVIRYLKTALEHVRAREKEEKALIDAVSPAVCLDPEWVMDVVAFKREKNVRNFNETWAKRFVNWVCSKRGAAE